MTNEQSDMQSLIMTDCDFTGNDYGRAQHLCGACHWGALAHLKPGECMQFNAAAYRIIIIYNIIAGYGV